MLQEQLETLHNAAGFRWADVGRILGISERTLRRRRHEFGLPVGTGEDFSDVSDNELDFNVWDTKRWSTPGRRGLKAQRLANTAPSYSRFYTESGSCSEHFKSSTVDNS